MIARTMPSLNSKLVVISLIWTRFCISGESSQLYTHARSATGSAICLTATASASRVIATARGRIACATRCLNERSIVCLIFSHIQTSNTCILSNSLYEPMDTSVATCKTYQIGSSGTLELTTKTMVLTYPPSFVYIANSCTSPFTVAAGWTVILRRCNGAIDFYRSFNEFANGFGSVDGEFYIGHTKVNQMTSSGTHQLRVDMQDLVGAKVYAVYSTFKVDSFSSNFKLTATGYSGNAGDSFAYTSGSPFSTMDADNDATTNHCAQLRRSAGWYVYCIQASPFGNYGNTNAEMGIIWYQWKFSFTYSMPYFEMSVL